MSWYQTQLDGKTGMVCCWVDRKLKRGQVVTLEKDRRKWKVIIQYPTPGQPGRLQWKVGGIEPMITT